MTPAEKEEIRMLIEMAYMPVAFANNRLNGMDFFETAVETLKALVRKRSTINKYEAAKVMMDFFNSQLDPKITESECIEFAQFIASKV